MAITWGNDRETVEQARRVMAQWEDVIAILKSQEEQIARIDPLVEVLRERDREIAKLRSELARLARGQREVGRAVEFAAQEATRASESDSRPRPRLPDPGESERRSGPRRRWLK